MKKLDYYFDEAKKITGSDYKTAQRVGLSRSGVSLARKKGNISNEIARKLAEIINVSPLDVIAAAEVTKAPEKEKDWMKWAAASVILTLGITTGYQGISTTYADIAFYNSIDYAQWWIGG